MWTAQMSDIAEMNIKDSPASKELPGDQLLHEYLKPKIDDWVAKDPKTRAYKTLDYREGRTISPEILLRIAQELDLNLGALLILKSASKFDGDVRQRLLSTASACERFVPEPRAGCSRSIADWALGLRRVSAVVTGDRIEAPPRTIHDLLARSSSYLELRYLSRLQFAHEAELFTHKEVLLEPTLVKRHLGGDILLVGSAETNLVTRSLLRKATFFSELPSASKPLEDEIATAVAKLEAEHRDRDPSALGNLENRLKAKFNLKELQAAFTRRDPWEFVDPLRRSGDGLGNAVVNLAPWEGGGIAIIVAGARRWRTAIALKLLSKPGFLYEHPLGGVLDIRRHAHLAGWDLDGVSLEHDIDWVTPAYKISEYEDAARALGLSDQAELARRFRQSRD
jgi:hypothetical protein